MTTTETLARLDEIKARAAAVPAPPWLYESKTAREDVPALVAACRELAGERDEARATIGWMAAALNGEPVDDAGALLDPVRLALAVRACVATCGCGDGIMPDTGAACGVCHSLAENDRDRHLERLREPKARLLPIVEMRLCEIPHLFLKPQTYRFTVDPDCAACVAAERKIRD